MSLSIFDRIEIAMAIRLGERDFKREQANFKKEQKRANRAAGDNKNNGNNSDSNTGKKKSFESKKNKKDKPSKDKNQKQEKNNDTALMVIKNTSTVEEVPKTEQQINAEAQAPEEAAGAEMIKTVIEAQTTVDSETKAAMSTPIRVDDNNPNSLDFSYFGMSIDVDKMNGGNGTPDNNLFDQQVTEQPNNQQQPRSFNPAADIINMMDVPSSPMMPQQFQMDPMNGMNTYANMLNHQQNPVQMPIQNPYVNPAFIQQPPQQFIPTQPPVGFGNHRVDMPEKPKPAKGPKSKPDNIDMEGMPDVIEADDVMNFPKFNATTIGVVEDKPSMETKPVSIVNRFKDNNEKYFKEFPFLIEIEKIALNNGYQIGFFVRPNKLIDCYVYNDNNVNQPIQGKGFTIDPGMIIDRRKKIFVGIMDFYEGMNAYPLFINGKSENDKKTGSKLLNVELLTNLIVGGNMAVQGVKGMYTDDFRNLNKYVALITIPTNKNGPEDRKYIQKRLVDLYKSNVYDDVLMSSPNARFRIAEYIKSSGTILLDTAGVPSNYGGTVPNVERVQLKITRGDYKILRGDNIIDVIPGN